MKKLVAIVLALAMVFCMSMTAFAADDQDVTGFTKVYTATNADTTSPAETFTFKFTPVSVTNSNNNLQKSQMPTIADSTVTVAAGAAATAGASQAVSVALSNVTWPGVGVYIYDVTEVAGTTAGVTYDDTTAKMKVTVAYDSNNDTYYTAFVTLSLADANNDGITDVKVAGFENTYSAGSLTVTKTVTGNFGDKKNKAFDVTVEFTQESGTSVASTITYGSKTIAPTDWKDGKVSVTVSLKHGNSATFTNIPYGVTYTVTEADYTSEAKGGYDEPDYDFSDSEKVIDSALDTVIITNNKDLGKIDTGILLDNMPYVLLLVAAGAGVVVLCVKKRAAREQ